MGVEAGQVHGFLGPNGSGKTTTLRTLLGLIRPDGGRMRILGQAVPSALPHVVAPGRRDRGEPAVLPALHRPHDTLSLLPRPAACRSTGSTRCSSWSGCATAADERVKTYSLGMKQRLAVASALLKDPSC